MGWGVGGRVDTTGSSGVANGGGDGLGKVSGTAVVAGVACGAQPAMAINRMTAISVLRPAVDRGPRCVRFMLKSLTPTDAIRYVTFVIDNIRHEMHADVVCAPIFPIQSIRDYVVLLAGVETGVLYSGFPDGLILLSLVDPQDRAVRELEIKESREDLPLRGNSNDIHYDEGLYPFVDWVHSMKHNSQDAKF
jgi:hypothetical protein